MTGFLISRRTRIAVWTLGVLIVAGASAWAQGKIIARVNGDYIKDTDVDFELISRSASDEQKASAEVRRKILDQLVEQELIKQYLKRQKIVPDSKAVSAQVERIRQLIERAGEKPDEVLARLGFTPVRLRSKLSFASMWRTFLRKKFTEANIQKYFEQRREQFDGTEIRARQIYLPVKPGDPEAEVAAAEKQLNDWRKEIVAGKVSFEQAAKQWSKAPSATDGGDVGFFPYRGKMPAGFSAAAFAQKVGEVGKPFRTRYGMHLVLVTEKRPGDFSLEDVRGAVTQSFYREIWDEIVKQQRAKAKIEIVGE